VKVAAKAHCPVASTNAHDIVEFLVAYEEANTDIPSTRVTNRPGWHDKAFMLGNGTCLGADDLRLSPVDGAQTMLAGMTQCGAWETWRDSILPIATKYPRVMAGVYASLVPVILPLLPTVEAFTIEWAGTTGTGKSTAMSVAASVWGSRQIIGTWNATRVGVEGLLSASGHLPVLLDDTKNCKWKGDIPQMLYDVTAGRGRVRGAAEGGMRAVPTWRTIVISTGEDACTSFSEDGGSRARAVVMQGDTLGATSLATASDARQLKELADLNYGHLGPMFVEFVQKMMETPDVFGKIQAQVAQNRARIAQKLVDRGAAASTADRMGSHITLIHLVETLVSKMLKMPMTTSVEEELIACVAASSSDIDPSTRALADIRGWAVSHQDSFSGQRSATAFPPPQGWVGAWGVNDVSFLETVLREKLKAFGHSADSVLKTWEARGWLVMEGDRPRPKRSIGGKKMRVVAIKADIFDVSESDGMQQGNPNLGMDMFDDIN